jgi:hypothetical protein
VGPTHNDDPIYLNEQKADVVSSDVSASGYKYKELRRRLEIVKAAKGD